MKDNLIYIDLFDDAIYDINDYSSENVKNEHIKNTIRLQILLALLFKNRIVVPEQWALSSAIFLDIADEVIEGYKRKITVQQGKSKRHILPKPPFIISFRNRKYSGSDYFSESIIERLDGSRRLMTSAVTADPSSEKYQSARSNLRNLFVAQSEMSKDKRFDNQFEGRLADLIQDDHMAVSYCKLARYIDEFNDPESERSSTAFHSVSSYERAMGLHASNVKDACFNDPILMRYNDGRIAEFKDMFLRAKADKIPISSFMDMWKIAENYSPGAYQLITRMGQYCMHRSMAENTFADFGSTFYGAYVGETDDNFEEVLIDRTRRYEHIKALTDSSDRDFRFLATTHAKNYDMLDKLEWANIWSIVAEFSYSEEWDKTLKELVEKLDKVSLVDVHQEPFWHEVFDRINGRLNAFRFRRSSDSEGLLETILTGARDIRDRTPSTDGTFNTVVSTFAMLASLASATVKLTPLEIELKATRVLRKGKQISTALASNKNT